MFWYILGGMFPTIMTCSMRYHSILLRIKEYLGRDCGGSYVAWRYIYLHPHAWTLLPSRLESEAEVSRREDSAAAYVVCFRINSIRRRACLSALGQISTCLKSFR